MKRKVETVEEFLKRGGKVEVLPPHYDHNLNYFTLAGRNPQQLEKRKPSLS